MWVYVVFQDLKEQSWKFWWKVTERKYRKMYFFALIYLLRNIIVKKINLYSMQEQRIIMIDNISPKGIL